MKSVYNVEFKIDIDRWISIRHNYPTFEQALERGRASPYKTFRIIQTAIEEGEIYREVRN